VEIRLTRAQFDVIERHFGAELRYQRWFSRAHSPSQKVVWAMMPAIGWLRLRDQIAAVSFTARGQRDSRVPRALSRGLSRISKSLADLQIHPALRGVGLRGTYGQVIPSWRLPEQERRSEFPVIGGEFEVLFPHWEDVSGMPVTLWRPGQWLGTSGGDLPRLEDEDEHLAFGIYERA
jgi:hypothetical protein